jgi:flagellar protein FlbD
MIEVERINGGKIAVNPDLIKYIESRPDTIVVFTDGERMILKTSPADIINLIIEYRRKLGLPEIRN